VRRQRAAANIPGAVHFAAELIASECGRGRIGSGAGLVVRRVIQSNIFEISGGFPLLKLVDIWEVNRRGGRCAAGEQRQMYGRLKK
jgi:hypothetical protein